jgi:hypothetical protein
MRFDPSGFDSAFDRMEETAKRGGRTVAEQQGQFFIKIAKAQGWLIAPSTQTIIEKVKSLKGRIRHYKKGSTVKQELDRRIRARGTFARKWVTTKIESVGFSIRIWVMNKSAFSEIVDKQKHVFDKSAEMAKSGYKAKLDKLADQTTKAF